jgi:hypothetical protein
LSIISFFAAKNLQSFAMPPKKSEQLKRAADDLDEALNDSPVRKKKLKTNLGNLNISMPKHVTPPPIDTIPDPEFIDKFEPEAALRLTKASNSINFVEDKINFYLDLLSTFNNEADTRAITIADRTNGKIEKWGQYRDKVQKSMDVLLKIAPKKKANAMLNVDIADGFISSSGQFVYHLLPAKSVSSRSWPLPPLFFPIPHLIQCIC